MPVSSIHDRLCWRCEAWLAGHVVVNGNTVGTCARASLPTPSNGACPAWRERKVEKNDA